MTLSEIDAKLLTAHATNDHVALVALYTKAADIREKSRDVEAASFYLTQAYIFALEAGFPEASTLQHRLWKSGRETSPQNISCEQLR